MKPKFCKFIALIALALMLVAASGCRTIFVNSPEKKAAKKQAQQQEEAAKSYRASVKGHYGNQSKKTRRRMKRNLKKAERKLKKRMPKGGWECR